VTLIVQVALTASDVGQSFVWPKSPAFGPVRATLVTVSGAVPVFLSVDVCGALVVPTRSDPNARLAGVSVTTGAGVTPVPLSVTPSGLLAALSTIETLALLLPDAVGENVTVMVHVVFGGRDAGQSLDWAKSPALVPAIPMLVIVNASVPVFFRTEDCDALVVPTSCAPNARLVGVRFAIGAGAVPVPLSVNACGLPAALSETCTLAARGPVALGEKVTVIEQVAFTASDAGQLLVWPKSAPSVPPVAMDAIVSGAVPELRSVDDCEALVVPTT